MSNEIGIKIKKAREAAGMSQGHLARLIGVSQQQVSNWESGKNSPNIKHAPLLHHYLNLNLEDLSFSTPGKSTVSHVGSVISLARQFLEISVDELARSIEVTPQEIVAWENDQSYPTSSQIRRMAKTFGTTEDLIVEGRIEDMPFGPKYVEWRESERQKLLAKRFEQPLTELEKEIFTKRRFLSGNIDIDDAIQNAINLLKAEDYPQYPQTFFEFQKITNLYEIPSYFQRCLETWPPEYEGEYRDHILACLSAFVVFVSDPDILGGTSQEIRDTTNRRILHQAAYALAQADALGAAPPIITATRLYWYLMRDVEAFTRDQPVACFARIMRLIEAYRDSMPTLEKVLQILLYISKKPAPSKDEAGGDELSPSQLQFVEDFFNDTTVFQKVRKLLPIAAKMSHDQVNQVATFLNAWLQPSPEANENADLDPTEAEKKKDSA